MNSRITVMHGDSRDLLKTLAEGSIDSAVTDPPYALTSIVKRFANGEPAHTKTAKDIAGRKTPIARLARGFMGQTWDTGETAFDPEFWREVFRVLKPGAHLVAFSGTRTYHRMACAIEDAGFELRDQIGWLFGSGFPKSHNAGNGWGTALKPAWEPICLARKPLIGTVAENVLTHGTGALNIDGCRVDARRDDYGRSAANARGTINAHNGFDGKSFKIAERDGDYASSLGRWPANVIHDGSEEVVAAFPNVDGAFGMTQHGSGTNAVYGKFERTAQSLGGNGVKDSGSAARFFYTAKADGNDRLGSKHPTVKPVDLMQYLVRLVTPKGGLVLDPFAGTGTTGEAAFYEGMRAILIEREARFVADIHRRVALLLAGPDERAHATIKASGRVEPPGPLFAGELA